MFPAALLFACRQKALKTVVCAERYVMQITTAENFPFPNLDLYVCMYVCVYVCVYFCSFCINSKQLRSLQRDFSRATEIRKKKRLIYDLIYWRNFVCPRATRSKACRENFFFKFYPRDSQQNSYSRTNAWTRRETDKIYKITREFSR